MIARDLNASGIEHLKLITSTNEFNPPRRVACLGPVYRERGRVKLAIPFVAVSEATLNA
jgi:hypothetical protein